ncbi:MAG TPA: aldehyde dehydrogenase family protein [Solirubrobacterales bacterium]
MKSFDIIDPSAGCAFAQAPAFDRDAVDASFTRALAAFRSWSRDEEARRSAMLAAAGSVEAETEELAALLTTEQGKPLAEAEGEVRAVVAWMRYFAGLEVEDEVIREDESAVVRRLRRPMGVVAAIASWNYPLLIAAMKLAPALRAGDTVVLKPSPYTPLATARTAELMARGLPPGVFEVVTGGDEVGAWMTAHPIPRKVSFTGSIGAGKLVAAAVAPDLKRVTLELGGNDAAIMLEDAEPAVLAPQVFAAAFRNCGQICSAIKRVYVAEPIYEEVVEAFAERARELRLGPGLDRETEMGPINNPPQLTRVKELVEDALAGGGTALAGGTVLDRPGYFFAPTIVADVAEGTRLVDEEQFGPALPVMPFKRVEEAVERANSTRFGLCGSVWSADPDRAALVAQELDCGTAWVNTHLGVGPDQPFGGHRWSGIGLENGLPGVESFSDSQTLVVAR